MTIWLVSGGDKFRSTQQSEKFCVLISKITPHLCAAGIYVGVLDIYTKQYILPQVCIYVYLWWW